MTNPVCRAGNCLLCKHLAYEPAFYDRGLDEFSGATVSCTLGHQEKLNPLDAEDLHVWSEYGEECQAMANWETED